MDSNALTFTSSLNYVGPSSFTFAVRDNGGTVNGGVDLSANAAVNITVAQVNDAPVNTVPAGTITVAEDGNVTIGGISVDDVDGNLSNVTCIGDHGNLTLSSANVTLSGNGTNSVLISGSQANINTVLTSLKYTPTANYNGSAVLTVVSNDGTITDTDSVSITVTSVNDAPTTSNAIVNGTEDVTVTLTAGDFPFTDALDVPSNTLQAVKIQSVPSGGTLKLNGVSISSGALISKSAQDNNLLSFVPDANFNGNATFDFAVVDNGGG